MGSLDPAKLAVVLVVALVVIGPERLPRAAQQFGRVWHQLSRARDDVMDEVRSAFPSDLARVPRPSRTVSSFLTDLTTPTPTVPPSTESPTTEAADGDSQADPPEVSRPRSAAVETSVTFDDPSLN